MTGSNPSPGVPTPLTYPDGYTAIPLIMHAWKCLPPSEGHSQIQAQSTDSLVQPHNGGGSPSQASRMERSSTNPKRLGPGGGSLLGPTQPRVLRLSPCFPAHRLVVPLLPRQEPPGGIRLQPASPWEFPCSETLSWKSTLSSAHHCSYFSTSFCFPLPTAHCSPPLTPHSPEVCPGRDTKRKPGWQTHSGLFLPGLHPDSPSRKSCEWPAGGARGPQLRRARCEAGDRRTRRAGACWVSRRAAACDRITKDATSAPT